jgi:hypothetical protein
MSSHLIQLWFIYLRKKRSQVQKDAKALEVEEKVSTVLGYQQIDIKVLPNKVVYVEGPINKF